jgi:hypothetical protein
MVDQPAEPKLDQRAAQPAEPNLDQRIKLAELQQREAESAHDRHNDYTIAMDTAAVESSHLTLRMALLINGGAAVAVLAFIGGLVAQGRLQAGPSLSRVAESLVLFALGVAVATLAQGGAYVTNALVVRARLSRDLIPQRPWFQENDKSNRYWWLAEWARWIGIILAFGSWSLFIAGALSTWTAVKKLDLGSNPSLQKQL